jgi:hypothetical protein
MNYTIITNCSSRKRNIGVEPLVPSLLGTLDVKGLLNAWLGQIQNSQVRVAPLDLYQGRSMADCRLAARLTAADFYVISAGLGLVSANDQVPNYSLTISEGTGSLRRWLSGQGATSADWWKGLSDAIGTPVPISSLVNGQSNNSRVLIALPANYIEMIATDLALVSQNRVDTVRIFTSNAGVKHVPSTLKRSVMPYDERLEGVANHGGTRSDFPQRALKHFVASLHAQELSLEDAQAKVHAAMTRSFKRIIPTRVKTQDEQIAKLIRTHWNRYEGSASKLLRFLRDDANVACEQSRFSGIWRKIKADHSSIKGEIRA